MVKKKPKKAKENSDTHSNSEPEFLGILAIPKEDYENLVNSLTEAMINDIIPNESIANSIKIAIGKEIDDIIRRIEILASLEAVLYDQLNIDTVSAATENYEEFNNSLSELLLKFYSKGVPINMMVAIMYNRISTILNNELSDDVMNRIKARIKTSQGNTPPGYI